MNKILKAIVYILILIFLYLWLSTVFDSCGNKTVDANADTESIIEEGLGDDDLVDLSSVVDEDDEFESEEEETSYEDQASNRTEDVSGDLTAPLEEDEEVEEPRSTRQADPAPAPRTYRADDSAPYLIVAGSFSQEGNANAFVDKLRRMGYREAEKVRFDDSKFYSVVAQRFGNKNTANSEARNLKSRGVDCYVHTRK